MKHVLRDISKDIVSNPMDLRRELYRQFGSELVSSDLKFAIGYVKGSSYVYIRSVADMDDVWKMATTVRSDTILWCEKTMKKDYLHSDKDSEEEDLAPQPKRKKISALDQKYKRIDQLVEQ